MKDYLSLIRIKHWIKNLLIFIPLICSGLFSTKNILISILGFFAFSFACSFIYVVNDLNDIEKDKMHINKKKRPLANGRISKIFFEIQSK